MLLAFAACLYGAWQVPAALYLPEANDVWFDGDLARVYGNMIARTSSHHDTTLAHPAFSLLVYLPVVLLRLLPGVTPLVAARLVLAGIASLSMGALYLLLRVVGCRRPDAILLSLLAGVSAGAVFWFTVPETFPLGSFTLMVGLATVAAGQRRPPSERWMSLVSALTLSASTTNWLVGILGSLACFPLRRAVRITVKAFGLILVLWVVQRVAFYNVTFFMFNKKTKQVKIARAPARFPNVGLSLLFHSAVAPEYHLMKARGAAVLPSMRTDGARPGNGSPWGAAGVVLWGILLCIGAYGLAAQRAQRKLALVIGATLLAQLLLHLGLGDETFLYSSHFLPLLVLVVAFGTLTRLRPAVLALAALSLVCSGVQNLRQFNRATEFARTLDLPQLAGRDFTDADFHGRALPARDMEGVTLYYADLNDAKLAREDLRCAYLGRAWMMRADLEEADLSGASLTESRLQEADLAGADLTAASLLRARLDRANLAGANLTRATLIGTNLRGANLTGTALTDARYDHTTKWPRDFDPRQAGAVGLDDHLSGRPRQGYYSRGVGTVGRIQELNADATGHSGLAPGGLGTCKRPGPGRSEAS
jgi:uncharacterized protein YjbI with pentapeptide repeats